jgi:hypothetical protein
MMSPPFEAAQLKLEFSQEMQQMFRDYVQDEVNRAIQRMQMSTTARQDDFTNMITSAATALGCNAATVTQCSNSFWTLDDKASCLELVGCYTAPRFPTGQQQQFGAQ